MVMRVLGGWRLRSGRQNSGTSRTILGPLDVPIQLVLAQVISGEQVPASRAENARSPVGGPGSVAGVLVSAATFRPVVAVAGVGLESRRTPQARGSRACAISGADQDR